MLFSLFAGLLYLAALLLPIFLLYKFKPMVWPVHVLAIIAAVAVGLAPGTALLNSKMGTFLYGFVFVFLLTWGLGGLIAFRWRRAKRATA